MKDRVKIIKELDHYTLQKEVNSYINECQSFSESYGCGYSVKEIRPINESAVLIHQVIDRKTICCNHGCQYWSL
jgi:hypothetical protein